MYRPTCSHMKDGALILSKYKVRTDLPRSVRETPVDLFHQGAQHGLIVAFQYKYVFRLCMTVAPYISSPPYKGIWSGLYASVVYIRTLGLK